MRGKGCQSDRRASIFRNTMDILIAFFQYLALASCVGVGLLFLVAAPYSVGRFVGERKAEISLAELSSCDRQRFELRVAELEVKGARAALKRAEAGRGGYREWRNR